MFLDAVVLIGVILTVLLLLALISKLNMQVRNTHDDLQKSTKTIERDMQCIGTFFSLKDRADLQISNLRSCKIINTKTNETHSLPLSQGVAVPASGTTAAAPSSSSVSTPAQTPRTSPSTPGNSGNTPAPATPPGVVQRIIKGVTNTVKSIL